MALFTDMLISAPQIEHWDRCRRMGTWLEQWQPHRIAPLGAVYAALDRVLTADPYPGPQLANDTVMELAGERGVYTDRDEPYAMMVHYAHLAEVLARVLRQPSTEPLRRHGVVHFNRKEHALGQSADLWQPESYLIDGDTRLMRVVLADHWDDNRQTAELHAWRTIGDVCVTGLPMTLRVLVIGHSQHGKRYGYWTKARQHPINKTLRFARKHGKEDGLAASWATVWREDSTVGPDAWVAQMARDGVLKEVAFDRKVMVPSQSAITRVKQDIDAIRDNLIQSVAMLDTMGHKPGMTRSACDDPLRGPCRFQCCCYGELELDPGETGLFTRKGVNL